MLPITANLEAELRSLGWNAFFIKDYVKSLKTSRGSIIRDPSEIGAVVAEMRHFRGDIEGGFCVRRVEPFIADSERRWAAQHSRRRMNLCRNWSARLQCASHRAFSQSIPFSGRTASCGLWKWEMAKCQI